MKFQMKWQRCGWFCCHCIFCLSSFDRRLFVCRELKSVGTTVCELRFCIKLTSFQVVPCQIVPKLSHQTQSLFLCRTNMQR